jgi:hypothetical protein
LRCPYVRGCGRPRRPRLDYLGEDYATTDCGRQLWAFRAYVRDRYGTAERAKAFWQANGWY